MVELLHLEGPCQVGTLARDLGEQVGSISHHLRMLERAGVVARAPELATDGRTSWWRLEQRSLSWSVEDFDHPADRAQAKAAERLNLDHQLGRLAAWRRSADHADPSWRRAAFATDFLALATPDELAELSQALEATLRRWRDGLPDRPDDGEAPRAPVFVFLHGFPTRP
jgi:DNA-binding transcriptional ArsR family regulator